VAVFKDRALAGGFTLAVFRPEDAPGVVACYREMYGDNFPMRYVYDPQAIVEKNVHGGQHTLVVRSPKNDVAGLAGLIPVDPENGLYEASQLMVRRAYRSQKLGRALNRAVLEDLAPAIGAAAVFGETVCNSTISQSISIESGLLPTGLELDVLPGGHGSKISLLYMFKIFADRPHSLFASPQDMDFLQDSCQRLGLTREFEVGAMPRTADQTVMDSERLDFAGLVRARVRTMGKDFIDRLDAFLRQNRESIIQVQVDLAQQGAPWALDVLRARGFFLGGHLPLWRGTDYLMLQRLPREPDLDRVQMLPGQPQRILEMITTDLEQAARQGA
jgi:hypothetical protein